jgi:hypothetical protein
MGGKQMKGMGTMKSLDPTALKQSPIQGGFPLMISDGTWGVKQALARNQKPM